MKMTGMPAVSERQKLHILVSLGVLRKEISIHLLKNDRRSPASFVCDIACIKWCASQPLKLWNTTGIGIVLGFIRSFLLHASCAAPRKLPEMWQWPFTASLKFFRSSGLPQNKQSVWVFSIHLSAGCSSFLLFFGPMNSNSFISSSSECSVCGLVCKSSVLWLCPQCPCPCPTRRPSRETQV